MTSALQSSCEGLQVSGTGVAATLAWTHSILQDSTFTSTWQASFRALCLSFEIGTLQPHSHPDVERIISRPALGSSRQVRFNPTLSVALGLDDDWTLHSFSISEASPHNWSDKPWSCHRLPLQRQCKLSDDRIHPLRHLPGAGDSPDGEPAAGPFLHEAPQSIQDLFQALFEERYLIVDEMLTEPILLRSWYVHHRQVPEWTNTSFI